MSSIPVRKAVTVGSRPNVQPTSGISPPDKNGKATKVSHSSRPQKEAPRPLTRQSSKKELCDENTKLKAKISAHEDRLKDMQRAIDAEKERFGKLEKDSCNKENSLKGNIEEFSEKSEKLELKMHDYEKKLLMCNIDPVTLERLDPGVQAEELIQERCEQAKGRVVSLKEKLKSFNQQALSCIENMQVLDDQLDNIDSEMTTNPPTTINSSQPRAVPITNT